jgi:SAM-dependent methyltransferase
MNTAAVSSETNDPGRRLNPRIVDGDWLVMRGMAREIRSLATRHGSQGAVVIDYGCGSMPYRRLFEEAGCRYLGADFEGAPDIAIDPAGRMATADASADLVVSFQVLEHVRNLGAYFLEIRRVLKPEGRLVLSTHGTWLYHPHPEDHRRWTRQGLVAELEAHGFAVEAAAPVLGPLAWTTVLRLTCFRYALGKAPLIGAAVGGMLSVLMNLRAWAEDAVTPAWVTADNACVYVTSCRLRDAKC